MGERLDNDWRSLLPDYALPPLYEVERKFPRPRLKDVRRSVRSALRKILPARGWNGKPEIGITAGSRGIDEIVTVLAVVVEEIKKAGGRPVIVASMGSHGGGTSRGQREILHSLGIDEEAVEAEIHAGERTVEIGRVSGVPVRCDRRAALCEALLVVNRVKPHTALRGSFQSGLSKMMVVGLGKRSGAEITHSFSPSAMSDLLPQMAAVFLEQLPILGGLALIENGYREIADVTAVPPEEIPDREPQLLERASELMPTLPFDQLDVLLIQEMGKNYAGTGVDVHVVGRYAIRGEPEPEGIEIGRIVGLRLSEESHGNAHGMGLVDFATSSFREAVDFKTTYTNTLTSTYVKRSKMPLILPTDKLAIDAALYSLRPIEKDDLRMCYVHDTLNLQKMWVSPPLASEIRGRDGASVVGEAKAMVFSERGVFLAKEFGR